MLAKYHAASISQLAAMLRVPGRRAYGVGPCFNQSVKQPRCPSHDIALIILTVKGLRSLADHLDADAHRAVDQFLMCDGRGNVRLLAASVADSALELKNRVNRMSETGHLPRWTAAIRDCADRIETRFEELGHAVSQSRIKVAKQNACSAPCLAVMAVARAEADALAHPRFLKACEAYSWRMLPHLGVFTQRRAQSTVIS